MWPREELNYISGEAVSQYGSKLVMSDGGLRKNEVTGSFY